MRKLIVNFEGFLFCEIFNIERILMVLRENENLDKIIFKEILNCVVVLLIVEESLGNLENLLNERKSLRKWGVLKFKGYKIERNESKVIECGNIDVFDCNNFVKKFE